MVGEEIGVLIILTQSKRGVESLTWGILDCSCPFLVVFVFLKVVM